MHRIGSVIALSIGALSTVALAGVGAQGIPAPPGSVQVAVAADASASS